MGFITGVLFRKEIEQVNQGRQVFVICPLIEKPDTGDQAESLIVRDATDDKKTVMSEYKKLSETIFPDLKVGFVHGKLKPDEKEEVMKKFTDNEISILVSTSVVEVGVNIPNATVMMIEGADRFGLAQLHQFRGRVGRSDHQSYCFLFTDSFSKKVAERLKFFEQCHDGFKLAEKDLEIRGPGEVYGREQSGMMQLRLATLTDTEIIKKAREAAHRIVPDLEKYSKVLEKMKKWKEEVHLE
jgi:ATP-dependent DNA helicase RecG